MTGAELFKQRFLASQQPTRQPQTYGTGAEIFKSRFAPQSSLPTLGTSDYSGGYADDYSDTSGGIDNYDERYNEIYNKQVSELDKYLDDLLNTAQGDYDYASKWLESEYKVALGNDDVARQKFIKSVASEMENKIGTIAYDYKTGTYRTEQDKEIALTRLAEDEKTIRSQYATEDEIAREEQGAGLNQRGLMSGTRETTEGLGAKFIDRLEGKIKSKEMALTKGLKRTRGDIALGFGRTMDDFKTAARRGASTTQMGYDKGKEGYQRALDAEKARIERERMQGKSVLIPQYAHSTLQSGYFS